ncbi:stage III sporulation protein AF [Halalkalibacterium halodurans]|uniref:Mutants block sporulation after engulfment n=2 Tax=Halalkalibacterium halodurans TaxID=86665 RepID=Q9K958_HALH5|nr:stage III sporulation protein AF [Halalkalibacterium halodurans]MDY7223345.1 stage III sporulation protein AF [Halalkalibacterium halodurans]MDY7242566.1 stage III sporulation protein AF [Halalkalibacterium halodurans]MED3646879.1 stage III sporulation protein AF [Halalkalibacterium halodurans]MED4080220.1 stage III sporulation protein AF [Halalkalibacterium halodurans]MED4084712.1 stage III sporulation protein AF [Halalkalibacterium halodurans]
MGFLTDWLTNLILLILLATILELLLPNSMFQRYVRMVVGLLLLVVMLQPVLAIVTEDLDTWFAELSLATSTSELSVESDWNSKKDDIESDMRAYISEQMAVQLKRQVEEEFRETYGVQIQSVDVVIEPTAYESGFHPDQVQSVTVLLTEEADDESVSIEVVSPVQIDLASKTEDIQSVSTEDRMNQKYIHYLAEVWQIPEEMISLVWEGGEQGNGS